MTAKIVYTPLKPSSSKKPSTTNTSLPSNGKTSSLNASAEFLRAPNEDDDGYDPYSDLTPTSPLFEANPWD